MTKWIAVIALTLTLPAAAFAEKKASLSPTDYEEIRALYAKYAFGFDTGNAEIVKSVYAVDGQFIVGGKPMGTSRDAIAGIVRAPQAGGPQMKHVMNNVLIEPAADGASGAAYVVLVSYQEGKAPSVTGGGSYKDVLVKTADGWRFKKREYSPFPAGAPMPAAK